MFAMSGRELRATSSRMSVTFCASPSMRAFENRAMTQKRPGRRFGGGWHALLLIHLAAAADAGNISVAVKDNDGAPVKDAVVYAIPVSRKPPAARAPAVVAQ